MKRRVIPEAKSSRRLQIILEKSMVDHRYLAASHAIHMRWAVEAYWTFRSYRSTATPTQCRSRSCNAVQTFSLQRHAFQSRKSLLTLRYLWLVYRPYCTTTSSSVSIRTNKIGKSEIYSSFKSSWAAFSVSVRFLVDHVSLEKCLTYHVYNRFWWAEFICLRYCHWEKDGGHHLLLRSRSSISALAHLW